METKRGMDDSWTGTRAVSPTHGGGGASTSIRFPHETRQKHTKHAANKNQRAFRCKPQAARKIVPRQKKKNVIEGRGSVCAHAAEKHKHTYTTKPGLTTICSWHSSSLRSLMAELMPTTRNVVPPYVFCASSACSFRGSTDTAHNKNKIRPSGSATDSGMQ